MSSSQETQDAPDRVDQGAPDRAGQGAPDRAGQDAPDRAGQADPWYDIEEPEGGSTSLHKAIALMVAVIVVAVVVLAIFTTRQAPQLEPGKPVPGEDQVLSMLQGVPQHGFMLGNPSAPLTLVEFADLRCGACAEFEKQELPDLISGYVRSGELKLVFRPLDLNGPDSLKAARFAAALAQQNRLWQFAGLVYRNQESASKPFVTETYVAALIAAIPGADLAEASTAHGSAKVNGEIARFAALAQRRHLTATPAFLLSRSGGHARALPPKSLVDSSAFDATLEAMLRRR